MGKRTAEEADLDRREDETLYDLWAAIADKMPETVQREYEEFRLAPQEKEAAQPSSSSSVSGGKPGL
jgi:hypothetical protein